MRVTVCQLQVDADGREAEWRQLQDHLSAKKSDFLLLPEMPFAPWLASSPDFDPADWQQAVASHEEWIGRLDELGVPTVASTRPINKGARRHNQAYVWQSGESLINAHDKYYLPDEDYYWEASWYQPPNAARFVACQAGPTVVGFQICTEMWFMQHAREYGKQGVQLNLVPRATPHESTAKWVAGGQAAAVISGAYCLSSNLFALPGAEANLGGVAFICGPEGDVLATTDAAHPFATLNIDLDLADRAKATYPRYVID